MLRIHLDGKLCQKFSGGSAPWHPTYHPTSLLENLCKVILQKWIKTISKILKTADYLLFIKNNQNFIEFHNAQNSCRRQVVPKIFRGLRPLAPHRGAAPGPRWGLLPQTPAAARSARCVGLIRGANQLISLRSTNNPPTFSNLDPPLLRASIRIIGVQIHVYK